MLPAKTDHQIWILLDLIVDKHRLLAGLEEKMDYNGMQQQQLQQHDQQQQDLGGQQQNGGYQQQPAGYPSMEAPSPQAYSPEQNGGGGTFAIFRTNTAYSF